MIRWLATLSALLLALGLHSAVSGQTTPPVEIDVFLAMTGTATFVGKTDHDALAILETMVNKQGGIRGRALHFIYHDDQSDPRTAIELLGGVLPKHPAVILGSNSFASCRVMAPLISAAGPVEYCLSPAMHPAKGSYSFSSSASTADELKALITYFRERGLRRIATLAAIDIGGQGMDADLATILQEPQNKGMELVAKEHFNLTDFTVMAELARIKTAQPQAVILWASGTPFSTQVRDAAAIGLDLPIGVSNANMNYVQMKQYGTAVPKELLFPGPAFLAGQAPNRGARNAQRSFYDAFAAAGTRPDFIDSTAWDPGLIVVAALRALGPDATADQIRSYIEDLHGFPGVAGEYDFRDGSQRGLSDKDIMITRWDASKQGWTAVSRLGGAPLR